MKAALIALVSCVAVTPLDAQELVVGLGYTSFNKDVAEDGAALELEYHFAPRWKLGNGDVYLAAAAMVDDPGDYFIGAGLGADFPLGDAGWFVQGSVMPGYYNASDANNDLGDDLAEREGGKGIFVGRHLLISFLSYPQKRGQRRTKAAPQRPRINAPTRERSEWSGQGA